MPDFRVESEFFTHPKTTRLIRLVGPLAPLYLIRLWGYAAVHRTSGDLSGIDDEDLEDAVGAEAGFMETLRDNGWMDGGHIHDWRGHQPWVCGADERKRLAKKAADSRWNAERMRSASNPQCGSDAPSPLPSPLPEEASLSALQADFGLSPPPEIQNGDAGFEDWWTEMRTWFKLCDRKLREKSEARKIWKSKGLARYADEIRERTREQRIHFADAQRLGGDPIKPQDPHRYLKNKRYNDETP